ncbi:unnamed protein product (mitochondrion) [Plasmodiophora brassicae]|nr:unnamed protein product [Plasmodiophora brassicae]
MPDGCRAIEVLCGPNFSCVLDTAGNVTTFGSDSPRGRLGRPGEKTDDPGRISVAAASGRPVCRIAQCASALICATATSISHIDVSSLCASGGTLITLFGNGMASINGLVWVRFRYLPYLDLTVEVDCSIYEGEPGPFCVRVVSPCLTKLVPGELFPLKNLEISTSMDGTFYSAPLPVAVFRAIESLNAGERQCGPVSGGSPVTLSVDVDDLPYPDLRVQLIPDHQLGRSPSVKPPDVPAVYDRTKKQITFKTPPTDDAGACHFAIALDGKTFVEYAEPKFVYYDAQLSSIDPASVPFGGGPLCVKMTGLDHPLLLDIQPVPRVRVTALSTGAVHESSGSADRLSLECIMRFDLPQLPFQGRNERVKIDVSYNGNEFMPCGQVEYEPPRAERLVPESGPKARDNSVVVAGFGFYEQQSLDVFLSPEQTVHSTFVDRSTIRFTLPVGIVLPSIQVALDASMRNALTYTLYDEPTSFKLEPSAGAAAGGYPVKLTAKNVFDTRASAVRVTGSSGGPAQVVPCQMTSEPNPKTGLAVVTFTMPSMLADPPSKTCTVELSLNGVDFTMVDVPFTLK